MDILSAQDIKQLLEKHGIHAKKSLGQNFLIDEKALQDMVQAANLSKQDTVVEIGPGLGALTKELIEKAGRVIAIEKDDTFARLLPEILGNPVNLEVVHKDILQLNVKYQISNVKHYKVVANLPYGITSPVIRKFLEEVGQKPKLLVLTVQKEVAQRICSAPPKSNFLAVSVQYYGTPNIVSYVDRKSFWPVPAVDSAIISIIPHSTFPDETKSALFFSVVKAGFKQPKKQLINNLAALFQGNKEKAAQWLRSQGVDFSRRAGTLTIEEWQTLAKNAQER
ncbi:MAG: ribosomal RNA small subunit methyltransferase A [Candidatus Wildermuthbacteria bacterium]|nr:ribosomal RNA small subunit methyltransferase A [Candidatus Wildermuthbacteria bacterium]